MTNRLGFLGTLDERVNITVNGQAVYRPGELDLDANIDGPGIIGELQVGARGFGALDVDPYGFDNDYDVYTLGTLSPGTYRLEAERYDWDLWPGMPNIGPVEATVRGPGLSPVGEGTTDPGWNGSFTVTETGSFWLRVSGRAGDPVLYTVVVYEDGTQPVNTPADWLTNAVSMDPRVNESVFEIAPRYEDPDGIQSGTLEREWFVDGQSRGFSDEFTPGYEDLGAIITIRYRFLDGQNTYEVSDFYTIGEVYELNQQSFFTFPFRYDDPVSGAVFDATTVTAEDGDGTRFQNFRYFWSLDGEVESTDAVFRITDDMIGQELSLRVNFNDDKANLEEDDISLGVITAPLPSDDAPDFVFEDTVLDTVSLNQNVSLLGLGPMDLTGSDLANRLMGNASANTILGRGGRDDIWGLGGDDTLLGGPGDDTLEGFSGTNLLGGGPGNDWVVGGEDNDAVYGGPGDDSLQGGEGNDLLGGSIGDDTLEGQDGDDALWASAGNDSLSGGAGNDTLGGATGDDWLDGGAGDDELWGSAGNDTLFGGDGSDLIGAAAGDDRIEAGADNDEVWGAAGADTLLGQGGNDRLGAGLGDDSVDGGLGDDAVYGGLGHDTLSGGSGDDTIFGASGDDVIAGGAGNDEIYVGPGADVVQFGAGADVDTIRYFSVAQDRLELDDALWAGTLDEAEIVADFGGAVGPDYVLDFDTGDRLILAGLGDASGTAIAGLIDIV